MFLLHATARKECCLELRSLANVAMLLDLSNTYHQLPRGGATVTQLVSYGAVVSETARGRRCAHALPVARAPSAITAASLQRKGIRVIASQKNALRRIGRASVIAAPSYFFAARLRAVLGSNPGS